MVDINICNSALAQIRNSSISAIDENSTQANMCSLYYSQVLESLLVQNDWSFARKVSALSLSSSTDTTWSDTWTYIYKLPNDCLSFRQIISNNDYTQYFGFRNYSLLTNKYYTNYLTQYDGSSYPGTRTPIKPLYEIIGENIYTNIVDAYGIYTYDIEDETKFPRLFTMAFTYALADTLCIPLNADPALKQTLSDTAQYYYSKAIESDAIGDGPTFDTTSRLNLTRL